MANLFNLTGWKVPTYSKTSFQPHFVLLFHVSHRKCSAIFLKITSGVPWHLQFSFFKMALYDYRWPKTSNNQISWSGILRNLNTSNLLIHEDQNTKYLLELKWEFPQFFPVCITIAPWLCALWSEAVLTGMKACGRSGACSSNEVELLKRTIQ